MKKWYTTASSIPSALMRELALLSLRGTGAREPLKASLSIMLAILLALTLGLDDIWWAAFSGYMVIHARFEESLRRGVFRIGGTAIGAVLAIYVAATFAGSAVIIILWIFLISLLTIYQALVSRFGYAWLFGGCTHVVVLAFAITTCADISHLVIMRIANVAVGAVACIAVSVLFELVWPSQPNVFFGAVRGLADVPIPGITVVTQREARLLLLRHAFEGALAVALVTSLGYYFKIDSFAQASISIFAVMVMPFTDFSKDRRGAVIRKTIHRAVGCLCGGIVGILMLFVTGHFLPLWWLALPTGVWIGRHVQIGKEGLGYFGAQFCLGYLTAFVHDPNLLENYHAPVERLLGVVTGLFLLGVILFVSRGYRESSAG